MARTGDVVGQYIRSLQSDGSAPPSSHSGGARPLGGDVGYASGACWLLVLEGLGGDDGAAGCETAFR